MSKSDKVFLFLLTVLVITAFNTKDIIGIALCGLLLVLIAINIAMGNKSEDKMVITRKDFLDWDSKRRRS